MFLYLDSNRVSFTAGETIKGSIFVQQQRPYRCVSLILTLEGKEKVSFTSFEPKLGKAKGPKGYWWVPCNGKAEVIKFSITIANFYN